jgi:gamma-glutamyltranspeptidase / glutathione hydrolase
MEELSKPRSRCVAESTKGMVSTAHPSATQAALKILQSGGNAIDAAMAGAWAISVCEPSGSGLGGQTTMLIHFPDGKRLVLDGHSYAPAGVSTKTVKRTSQKTGFKSTTIPSTVATLGAASVRFGKLPLSQVIAPAIELAENGFPVTRLFRKQVQWCRAQLQKHPAAESILFQNGKVIKRKEPFRQPQLAETLKRLASAGTDDFYRGQIAREIVADMERNQGLITAEDLAGLAVPVEHEPISTQFRGYELVSVPPPGGGLQLLQALKVLEQIDPDPNDALAWYETIARVMQVVYRDRLSWPFKPDEMTDSMHRWLVGPDRAAELAEQVRTERKQDVIEDDEDEGDTTHLCVADADGMVVTLTQSIQSLYGAKVASEKLGFFYNNYLSTIPRKGKFLSLVGNVAPRSNAAPTFVYDGKDSKKPIMAIGAAGSRRITSSIMQVIANKLVHGLLIGKAVDAPRIHGTLSGKAYVERRVATEEMVRRLGESFHVVEVKAARSYSMGGVQAIARDANGMWSASADPRREGTSGGL